MGDTYWAVEVDGYEEFSYVNFNQTIWPVEMAPECWGDYDTWANCNEGDDMYYSYYSWDDESYYYWGDSDWSYSYSGDYYGGWDEWYYYGDDWAIYAAQGDKTTMMSAAFQDFFYWAIIGESDEPGDCMATCGEMETMCCAGVSLR